MDPPKSLRILSHLSLSAALCLFIQEWLLRGINCQRGLLQWCLFGGEGRVTPKVANSSKKWHARQRKGRGSATKSSKVRGKGSPLSDVIYGHCPYLDSPLPKDFHLWWLSFACRLTRFKEPAGHLVFTNARLGYMDNMNTSDVYFHYSEMILQGNFLLVLLNFSVK